MRSFHFFHSVPRAGGENERQRGGEVRGDFVEDDFFDAGFADETDAALGEVAKAAVEQAGGSAGGAEGEVGFVEKRDAQAAHGGVARDAGADDAAADDEDVEGVMGDESRGFVDAFAWAFARWHGRLAHAVQLLFRTGETPVPRDNLRQNSPRSATLRQSDRACGFAAFACSRVASPVRTRTPDRAAGAGHGHVGVEAVADDGELVGFQVVASHDALEHARIGFAQNGIGLAAGGVG